MTYKDLIKSDDIKRVVGIIVIKDGSHLLVGNRDDNNSLVFPGGHVKEDETFFDAATRECEEETGIKPSNLSELFHDVFMDNAEGHPKHLKVYFTRQFEGDPADTKELKNVKFNNIEDIDLPSMSDYALNALQKLLYRVLVDHDDSFKEKIKDEKNKDNESLIKEHVSGGMKGNDVTYGDALNIVGTKVFKFLQQQVEDMNTDDTKEFEISDKYLIKIRKHEDGKFSGRILEFEKIGKRIEERDIIFSFSSMILIEIAIAVLSLSDWKMPKGLSKSEVGTMFNGENLPVIMKSFIPFGQENMTAEEYVNIGLKMLMNKYKENQIQEFYDQMKSIKESLQNDVNVDMRSIETRMMKMFDKLDTFLRDLDRKQNEMNADLRSGYDILEAKLLELKNKIDEYDNSNTEVKVKKSVADPNLLYKKEYFFHSKPLIKTDKKDGEVVMEFEPDWSDDDIKDFLSDMKARLISKKKTKKDNSEIKNMIVDLLKGEYQQWDLYYTYAEQLKGLGRGAAAGEFIDHADEEAEHIESLTKYLFNSFDAKPEDFVDRLEIEIVSQNNNDIINLMIKYEKLAVDKYKNAIKKCEEIGEEALRIELENILVKEQEHVNDLEALVEKVA